MNKKDNENISIKELVYGICDTVDIENVDEIRELADRFNSVQGTYIKLFEDNNHITEECAVPMYRIMLASNNIRRLNQAILTNDESYSLEQYIAEIVLSLKTVVEK